MISFVDFKNTPIDYTTLVGVLVGYASPKDKIASLEKQQKIIRIKKGLFVGAPEVSGYRISRELIANHLYGPSYVSLESALTYHGIIPERVYSMRSVTTKRSKIYDTPLGRFDYQTIPNAYYPIGIQQFETENNSFFMMATPEKALCDLILCTAGLRLQSTKAIQQFLENNLRIDIEQIKWNTPIIQECIMYGKKNADLQHLLNFLESHV